MHHECCSVKHGSKDIAHLAVVACEKEGSKDAHVRGAFACCAARQHAVLQSWLQMA